MPVIQTATRVIDKFGADRHGFTSGDAQAGEAPTQLSPEWCDGVQEEINNTIVYGDQTIDSDGPYTGLRKAIAERIANQRTETNGDQTFRSPSVGPSEQPDWVVVRNTRATWHLQKNNSTSGGVVLPSDCQATARFVVSVVRCSSPGHRANFVLLASFRRVAGTVNMQKQEIILEDTTFDCLANAVAGASSALCQVTVQNTAPVDNYNVLIMSEVTIVTVN